MLIICILGDLFTATGDSVFSSKVENLFGEDRGIFQDKVSAKLQQDNLEKSYRVNMAFPNDDVPPPLTSVCKFNKNNLS